MERPADEFQSPSLRGSGRFAVPFSFIANWFVEFQSPSLRGSGRFEPGDVSLWVALACFNPLHCGAVVASRGWRALGGDADKFQSPSLRGSGRFLITVVLALTLLAFQSPSLRGSGRFGQRVARVRNNACGFNPLHCGAVVASFGLALNERGRDRVSIPFIAGQWSLHALEEAWDLDELHVSIPFIAGQWSLLQYIHAAALDYVQVFQSPSLRGSGRFWNKLRTISVSNAFQSPSLRGSGRFSISSSSRSEATA